jgi:putative radical SAM enzyme (TIGR03279 family)
MSAPRVVSVAAGSAAQLAGLVVGDEVLAIDGRVPRDVIEYRLLVDEARPELLVRRAHEELSVVVAKEAGEALGAEVSSALFDRVRTCDNHCEFCFIHQLPKGMRRSLYLKDDDYRLSFLYGNFTTLTRFTEMDLERIVTEHLSPLFVSIHSTDPGLRARMLRNRRGAVSLRWLRALLDAGIEVHGQIVVCPGVNDGAALEATLAGILDEYAGLATAACVPLGLSRFSSEGALRPHTVEEAAAVVDLVHEWQEVFAATVGRRLVYAADEYYLLAGREFPAAAAYDGFPQHENGIGMVRAFERAFAGDAASAYGVRPGFFAWVDGAPPEGYRARRVTLAAPVVRARGTVTVLTGTYGAQVLGPLLARHGADAELVTVENRFFGGNIGVAGLLTGADVARALSDVPVGRRVLLPDVCLSEGRFLDGLTLDDLPRPVEVVPSDGLSLRRALLGVAAAAS